MAKELSFQDLIDKSILKSQLLPWNAPQCSTSSPFLELATHFLSSDEKDENRRLENTEPINDISRLLSLFLKNGTNLAKEDDFENSATSADSGTEYVKKEIAEGEICNYCYKIVNKSKMRLHQATHVGEKPFHCEFCNKSFSRSDKLSAHQKSHLGESSFKCFCGKEFCTIDLMKLHGRTHEIQPDIRDVLLNDVLDYDCTILKPDTVIIPHDSIECPYCHVYFSGTYKFTRHLRTHTGDKPFSCKCGEKFNRSELLKKHQSACAILSMENSEGFSMINEETQLTKVPLIDPIKIESTSESPPSIEITPLNKSKKKREKPKEENSSPKRPRYNKVDGKFFCEFCSKAFLKSYKLCIHRRIHTGEKPFTCDTCGKTFTRKDHMVKHNNVHLKYRQQLDDPLSEASKTDSSTKEEEDDDSSHYNEHLTLSDFIGEKPIKDEHLLKMEVSSHNEEEDTLDLNPAVGLYASKKPLKKVKKTREIMCITCHESFGTKEALNIHSKIHVIEECEESNTLTINCPLCDDAIPHCYIETHMLSHKVQKHYECEKCPKTFKRKADIVRHKNNHLRKESNSKEMSPIETMDDEGQSSYNVPHKSILEKLGLIIENSESSFLSNLHSSGSFK